LIEIFNLIEIMKIFNLMKTKKLFDLIKIFNLINILQTVETNSTFGFHALGNPTPARYVRGSLTRTFKCGSGSRHCGH
jgi:hypothetical protein